MAANASDLESYRNYAAAGLLENIGSAATDLQAELDAAIDEAIDLLRDRDQALLENQIKLYVRARYYEQGDGGTFKTGSYLGDEILTRISASDAGLETWLKYLDYDREWCYSCAAYRWYVDWGDSNAITRDFDVANGLKEIKEFFTDPNGKMAQYGVGGVSDTAYAATYLKDIENLLTNRSLLSLVNDAYAASDKLKLLGGGQLDGDEHMWLYLKATDVNTTAKIARVRELARFYDEAMAEYVGTSGIYSQLLIDRGLTNTQLNQLYNAFKGNEQIRGFDWNNLSAM